MNKVDVKSVCLTRLCKDGILLGTHYINSLDIRLSSVIKNRAGFIKMHLKPPRVDNMALVQGTCGFALELEGVKW